MKKMFLILCLVMAAAGGLWFWGRSGKSSVTVDTTTVRKGDLIKAVSSTGTIEPVTSVDVGAQVSGTIKHVYVDYNSVVKKGDLIAEIDPLLLAAKVEQSRADVLSAKADIRKAQATVKNDRKTRDRNKELFSRDLIAESDLDSAQADYETAVAALNSAEASLVQARATLEYNETNLGYTKIYSPINGVVVDRAIDEGQTVNSSQTAPTLFTIAEDLTKMQVEAAVDEADIGQVKKGQKVEFTVDAYPDMSFTGEVSEIRLYPTTEDNVVTYTVIIKVGNPDLKLMPGMTANVSIISEKRENVFKVSSSALKFKPAASLVESRDNGALRQENGSGSSGRLWTYEEGKLKPITVEIGISDGLYTEVSGNLKDGLEVVTEMTGVEESQKGGSPFGFGRRR